MSVTPEEVLTYGSRCVTFRKRVRDNCFQTTCFIIVNKHLEEVRPYHEGKKLQYQLLGKKATIWSVFQLIRLVYDQDGVLIARRASPQAPLRFTGKGQSKRLTLRKK